MPTMEFEYDTFYEAVRCGDHLLIEQHLLNNIDPNKPDPHGDTAMHLAVKYDRMMVYRILLAYGARVDVVNSLGQTPIDCAIIDNRMNFVKRLLTDLKDVDAKDGRDMTPLYVACLTQRVTLARFLIENGAKVDLIGPGKNTLLHIAVRSMPLLFIEDLVKRGCDTLAQNSIGITPVGFAMKRRRYKVAQRLIELTMPERLWVSQGRWY